ncbi:MAG: GIY-YIG nuclease family protein [Treponema sp.]|nr:GIY-YIG nuclease family protein [Treponema sp.]
MAKCSKCGKSGLFFKVNQQGLCKDCERIEKLTQEEAEIKSQIENFTAKRAEAEKSYEQIKATRDTLYNQIASKAKEDALHEIQNQIDAERQELRTVTDEVESKNKQLEDAVAKQTESEKQTASNANRLLKIRTQIKSLQYSLKRYNEGESGAGEIFKTDETSAADELLSATVKLKFHLMDIRELRRRYTKNETVIKELLAKYQSRYTTKANMAIYHLMVIGLEAELQNALYNLSYSKLDKSIADVKAITAKYEKIAADGNQNIAPTVKKFIGEIEYLYVEAIKIEYEYYVQKERIKEEQKALREQMRQEAAERKQLEEEKKKVEAEESKYVNEIDIIKQAIEVTGDAEKIRQLEERLSKVQDQLNDVSKKKEEITTLQNGKAGYIYVISNLGSFGDDIFKVGMTRRLNPQDRVDELGSASVPFEFDVHSFIFSNNAPELEYQLHKQLNSKRVNKINLRKEFFRTTIDELEDLVYSLEPSAEFNKTMLAEQYHQSMSVDEVPDDVAVIDDEDISDDSSEENL